MDDPVGQMGELPSRTRMGLDDHGRATQRYDADDHRFPFFTQSILSNAVDVLTVNLSRRPHGVQHHVLPHQTRGKLEEEGVEGGSACFVCFVFPLSPQVAKGMVSASGHPRSGHPRDLDRGISHARTRVGHVVEKSHRGTILVRSSRTSGGRVLVGVLAVRRNHQDPLQFHQ